MQIEYEVKVLEINIDTMRKKFCKLWATYINTIQQKRFVYDFNPVVPNKWIRLRQKWDITELTIKQINNDSITWTQELEIQVSDFETTHLLLQQLWYTAKAYQENTRESYTLNWVEIEIDSWPRIPPYLEVEWKNEQEVRTTLELLGFTMEDATSINTQKVYAHYWIDLEKITDLRF